MKRTTKAAETAPSLPHNLDAEKSVLGAILLTNEQLATAAERVKASDFFLHQHHLIFDAMLEMGGRSEPIDLVTLSDELRKAGDLEAAGGAPYLASLVDGVPRVSNLQYYARIIKDKAALRRLIHASHQIQQTAMQGREDASTILECARLTLSDLAVPQEDASLFDTREELEQTADATFSITDFLQDYAVTAIAALTGNGKTWVTLNIVAALLFGPGLLWDLFQVNERAQKVLYFVPEVSRSTFKPRLKTTNLYDEVDRRLFIRTLSKGPALPLTDPRILREAKGAHVICDTAIRFMRAVDENSANEAAAALSADFFALQRAEAKSIIALFHSPKSFATQTHMSVENMIRGSSEFGAVLSTAWGLRQIDKAANIVHVECLKDRDVAACAPFQLAGRPYLDQEGSFRLHARTCGPLSDYLDEGRKNKGGAPTQARDARAGNVELVRLWLREDRNQSSTEIAARFRKIGVKVTDSTVRTYKAALDKEDKEDGDRKED